MIIPAKMTSASFNISITNDAILEQNETFALTIDPSSNFTIVDPDEATVIIVDDDSKGNRDPLLCVLKSFISSLLSVAIKAIQLLYQNEINKIFSIIA